MSLMFDDDDATILHTKGGSGYNFFEFVTKEQAAFHSKNSYLKDSMPASFSEWPIDDEAKHYREDR